MRLPLCDLAAWHLMVTCAGFPGPARYLPITVLARRYGMRQTLGVIVPRLRCQFRTCRQYPASVRLCCSLDERDTKLIKVVLAGPGRSNDAGPFV